MSVEKYYQLAKSSLFPICRSLTGNGVRKTLKIIKKEFPKLKIYKVSATNLLIENKKSSSSKIKTPNNI